MAIAWLTRGECLLALSAGVLTTAALLTGQALIQNVHIGTTNGLLKSMAIAQLIAEPNPKSLDPSNALYYPTYALLCAALDGLGIFRDVVWRQMAVLNALFAGLVGAASYLFVARWTGDRLVAALATLAYCLSGYVLLHGLNNEDIMPGFSIVFVATLLGCAWFGNPSDRQIALVAMIFGVGWLFEWRLMFPSLPPFLLALAWAPGSLALRARRVVLFLGAMVVPAFAIVIVGFVAGSYSFKEIPRYFFHLLWTGKGLGTGYAGFSVAKLWLLWSAVAEAVLAGRHVGDPNWLASPLRGEIFAGTAFALLLMGLCLAHVYRHRNDPRVIASFLILGGLFGAGAIFNLYSQPQDPQMQINVMIWTLFGWALLFVGLRRFVEKIPAAPVHRIAPPLLMSVVALVPGFVAGRTSYSYAGYDRAMTAYVARLDAAFDPASTVYALYDFDGLNAWLSLPMRRGVPPNVDTLQKAPVADPRFKLIGFITPATTYPDMAAEEQAHLIVGQIDRALALGYRVVTSAFWGMPEAQWIASFGSITGPEVPLAIRSALHANFEATLVMDDPYGGPWYRLTRKAQP